MVVLDVVEGLVGAAAAAAKQQQYLVSALHHTTEDAHLAVYLILISLKYSQSDWFSDLCSLLIPIPFSIHFSLTKYMSLIYLDLLYIRDLFGRCT